MLSNLSRWLAHEVVKITDQCEKISEISLKDKVRLFYDQKYALSMNKRSLECVTAVVIYSYYHIELSITTGYFGPRCHFSLYTGFCKSPEEVEVQLNLAWKSRAFGRDPFNQNFRKFRSKTQWIGSVQPEKFRKNGFTFWGGPLFPVGPVGILVEWIAPFVLFYRTALFWFVSWFSIVIYQKEFYPRSTPAASDEVSLHYEWFFQFSTSLVIRWFQNSRRKKRS